MCKLHNSWELVRSRPNVFYAFLSFIFLSIIRIGFLMFYNMHLYSIIHVLTYMQLDLKIWVTPSAVMSLQSSIIILSTLLILSSQVNSGQPSVFQWIPTVLCTFAKYFVKNNMLCAVNSPCGYSEWLGVNFLQISCLINPHLMMYKSISKQ